MTRIFLSAGEPSGSAIGAMLMRVLKRRLKDVEFAGLGGEEMVREGMHLIYDPTRSAAMWLWGNLARIPAHRRALKACEAYWDANRPDLVITIDYQAFHLYVGMRARKRGIPVLHYVSSQFWARTYYTLELIRKAYSHVLCIHEFEKPYYDEAGIPATFVGHPLFERLAHRVLDAPLQERLTRIPAPRVGLLPGSRGGEITACLPVMLDAARRLSPRPRLLVSVGRRESRAFLERKVAESGLEAEIVEGGSGEIFKASDFALVTSGSVTMEAVYYDCPMVVVYRIMPLSYFFGKPQIAGFIAQPNLVARRKIVPEFLLWRRSGRGVAQEAQRLLDDADARNAQRAAFQEIREGLANAPTPSEAAADVAMTLLKS